MQYSFYINSDLEIILVIWFFGKSDIIYMRRKIDILDAIILGCKCCTVLFSTTLIGLIFIGILHLFDKLTDPIFYCWIATAIASIIGGVILLSLICTNDLINDIKYR